MNQTSGMDFSEETVGRHRNGTAACSLAKFYKTRKRIFWIGRTFNIGRNKMKRERREQNKTFAQMGQKRTYP